MHNESELYFKIIQNVSFYKLPTEVNHDIFKSQKRVQEYYSARLALQSLLLEKNISKNLSQLNITNYQTIEGIDDYVIGLTHTDNYSGATLASKKEFLSVGIDIEMKNRKYSQEALQRYFLPDDFMPSSTPSSQLVSWCMKEAAFKAIYPVQYQLHKMLDINISINTLKDIWIEKESFGIFNQKKKLHVGNFVFPNNKINIDENIIVILATIAHQTYS